MRRKLLVVGVLMLGVPNYAFGDDDGTGMRGGGVTIFNDCDAGGTPGGGAATGTVTPRPPGGETGQGQEANDYLEPCNEQVGCARNLTCVANRCVLRAIVNAQTARS